MNRKIFYAVLIITFAVMTLGGCGGSSSNFVADDEYNYEEIPNAETYIADDEIQNVDQTAMAKLFEELEADGTMEKVNARGYFEAFIEDGQAWTSLLNEFVSADKALELFSRDLKPHYDKGSVIAILSPNDEGINILLEALGEESNFSLPESHDELEMFAIVRASDSSGKSHLFTYNIPQRRDFEYELGKIEIISPDSSIQSSDKLNSYDVKPYAGTTSQDIQQIQTEYQVERWRDFYKWCAYGIDESLNQASSARQD